MKFEVCEGVIYVGSENAISGLHLYDRTRAEELARTLDWWALSQKIDELDAQGKGDSIERETYMQAYWINDELVREAYRIENEPKLWEFYDKHKDEPKQSEDGETWWDFFSDWHKDVYGVRPHYLRP